MRQACAASLAASLVLWLTSLCLWGQEPTPLLTVRSPLVQVPVLAKTRAGEVVFELTAADFVVTDNGVAQKVTLDADNDSQPLALAIVVETGGAGAEHLADYTQLDSILDALIGNVEHRVAVIGFGSSPHVLLDFTPSTANAAQMLANLTQANPEEDGRGAAILDAIVFAAEKLRAEPPEYRRAILLLGETVDQGSKTSLNEALRLLSDTNTAMYSFSFSSTRAAVSHEAGKFKSDTPGPAHGCFSRQGADPEYDGHYSKQVLDCISQLAPPLRLATMSFLAARSGLRTKTAESVAQLAGGEFFHFHNAKDLKAGLIRLSNDLPNYYVLSFRPTAPTPGLHALQVETLPVKPGKRSALVLEARREYWVDDDAAPKNEKKNGKRK